MRLSNSIDSSIGSHMAERISPWTLLIICTIFLIVSYSANHYWDEYFYLYSVNSFSLQNLLAMEPTLGEGLFPQAYFSVKIAFIAYLYGLSALFPGGEFSLLAIQFIFALHVLLFVGGTYLLCKELLGTNAALYSSIVLLFLPLSLYFSYKVLSEVFSLSWMVLGSWLYLRGVQANTTKSLYSLLALSVLFLLVGVLCRFTTVIFFGGMVAAIFIVGDERFPRFRLFFTSCCVVFSLAVFTLLSYRFVVGLPLEEIKALMGAVTVRSHGIALKVYSIFMTMQFFALVLLAACKDLFHKRFIFGMLWALFCSLPFVFLSEYVEPRYFYMSMVPLAILAMQGVLTIVTFLKNKLHFKSGTLFCATLGVVVIGNRLLFTDLMPYELNQSKYQELIDSLDNQNDRMTLLVPWISDFSFLTYRYPDKNIHLAWSMPHGEQHAFFHKEDFLRWGGGEKYIGSLERFSGLEQPVYYIGWRYNLPAIKIKRRMMWLKNRYVNEIEVHEGLKNHLSQSWVWNTPDLRLSPYITVGPYEAFQVTRKYNQ